MIGHSAETYIRPYPPGDAAWLGCGFVETQKISESYPSPIVSQVRACS